MGADIHPFLEVKIGGTWHLLGVPMCSRDYFLFGVLSCVRCDEDHAGICDMPDDIADDEASEIVIKEYRDWGQDAHSLTIVTCEDIDEMREMELSHTYSEGEVRKLDDTYITEWHSMLKKIEDAGYEAHIICWYDN